MKTLGSWTLWLAAVALYGCAAGGPIGDACETGSDCESGACNQGVCVDPTTGTGGGGGEGTSTGGSPAQGGGDEGGASGLCSPNHDGTIARDEVPLAAGLDAKFRVATNVTFSTASTDVAGTPTWDLTTALAGDHATLIETLPLGGTWFEASYPGATYAARLSDTGDLLGVFEITNDALLLRGVVSIEDGFSKTELQYDPAVVVLSFPLTDGATWSTDTTVSGTASGVFGVYYESYTNTVDGRGDVVTPFGTFDALRVRVDLTRTVGAAVATLKTFAFTSECFGTVATIQSQYGELGDEFTDVAEIKRLAP